MQKQAFSAINEIAALPKELVLVLDEFQVLDDAAIFQGLDFFIKHLPHNLHLVIASRSEPALDLAFLRAKGRIVELGADDPRFSGEEMALFFHQAMGLQLPPETVQALEERTDGWITALQMAAISLRHHSDPAAVLANLQGDAQELLRWNTSDEVGKSLAAFATQMGRAFLAHGKYLLSVSVPTGEIRAGKEMSASPVAHNETRPRRVVGRRYFILYIGGSGIGHLQIP